MTAPNILVVWTEIPVRDMDRAMKFYGDTFNWTLTRDDTGPNPMAVFNDDMGAVGGHLYPGTPGGDGPTPHIAVPDSLEATMARCFEAGGRIEGEPVEIPVGRFVYARDTEGNSIGFFEMKAA